ncbi:MAG: MerR family transcriptional regulator [Enorma sp.]|uniref:helix-turn-helix domain-containing protein n=1 Tax=Enorma sp. TaxID=1920692 RepID=UPI002586AF8D|nr:MerR family transcriptional regulator [Enorma sp.]MCI7774158.1 MerR family transcriptional regulator [Enorma sp.]
MWKRSDVERLTGLTRHMIQDLCNPNTSGDGLGFWEPAISKPGYSRFDEGDLLAFYLVRQLMKAGFTLKEIESAVFDLMEDDDSFEHALRRKATVLHRRRAELDSKLSALEYLEVAATAATDDRLYAVMEVALTQSTERAVRVATTEVQAAEADEELVRRGMRELVAAVLGALRGEDAPAEMGGRGIAPLVAGWARAVADLLADDAAPATAGAQRLIREMAHAVAGEGAGSVHDALASEGAANACDALASECGGNACEALASGRASSARDALAVCALAAFLNESENGVPIELVFGEGSFAFLAQAAVARVNDMDKQLR